jgi:hypothetical protein
VLWDLQGKFIRRSPAPTSVGTGRIQNSEFCRVFWIWPPLCYSFFKKHAISFWILRRWGAKAAVMRGSPIQIVERVPIEILPHELAAKYLQTKNEKLGHLLDSTLFSFGE